MPGPTGESNVLEFLPRGVVACIAADEHALVAQAQAAIAAGNTVLLLRSHLSLRARDALDPSRVVLADALDPARVDLVLLDARPEQRAPRARGNSPRHRAGSCPCRAGCRRDVTTGRCS